MSKKNPNRKQVMAVEIQPSADDSAAWYNPSEGGRNVQHRDHAYQPAVDATIHYTDGTRQSRREYVGEARVNRKAEAQAAAEQRGRELAGAARRKGVPVIGNVAGNRKRRSRTQTAQPAREIGDGWVIPFILVSLAACLGVGWLLSLVG
jgi:type IV secretory pathway VirB10-like protein